MNKKIFSVLSLAFGIIAVTGCEKHEGYKQVDLWEHLGQREWNAVWVLGNPEEEPYRDTCEIFFATKDRLFCKLPGHTVWSGMDYEVDGICLTFENDNPLIFSGSFYLDSYKESQEYILTTKYEAPLNVQELIISRK